LVSINVPSVSARPLIPPNFAGKYVETLPKKSSAKIFSDKAI